MENNEEVNYKEALTAVKKELYKQNYIARLDYIRKGIAYYTCKELLVNFQVPIEDMGDASFYNNMEAKYLIRWIKLV